MTAAIDEIYGLFVQAIQSYGWPILIILVVIYFSQPKIKQWRNSLSTRLANNPNRRSLLDEEVKRARMRQQLEVLKAAQEAKETKTEVPAKPTPAPAKPTTKSLSMKSSGRDYNPLLGPGGGTSFRSTRPTRKRGG